MEKLNTEELDQVAGGTFTPNVYSVEEYKTAGITCVTHAIEKDEFVWNGNNIGHYNANAVTLFHKINGHEPTTVDEAVAFREKWERENPQKQKHGIGTTMLCVGC